MYIAATVYSGQERPLATALQVADPWLLAAKQMD
jgi:hypothetical protein